MSQPIEGFDNLLKALVSQQTARLQVVAIVGAPGSGKSTLSEALAKAINDRQPGACAIVPMDGFHLDDEVLRARGRLDRKGAPDTFDAGGLVHLHRRLRENKEAEIAVPLFDRERELSRAGAQIVPQSVQLILVEGNYLLLRQSPWDQLAAFYDLTVYIDVPDAEIERRLQERWRFYDLSPEEAERRIQTNDLPNARLVKEQSAPADIIYAASAPSS